MDIKCTNSFFCKVHQGWGIRKGFLIINSKVRGMFNGLKKTNDSQVGYMQISGVLISESQLRGKEGPLSLFGNSFLILKLEFLSVCV